MSGTPLGNMVVKLGLDDADFGRGVENSKKQVRYLAKEMSANMKIADMAGNNLGKLGTRYDSLTKIIGAQEKQVASLKKAYDESFVDGKATESTKRLAAQLQDANGKLANYKQQLINTAGAYAELQVKTTGITGAIYSASETMIKAGSNMEKAGSALTKGLTVPIAAGAAAVTTAAISWESAFAGVKKTNDEVINSNGDVVYSYQDLENGLRNLAKELPSAHSEIAQVAETAGQLGIATENVVSFTKTMIDLGESTNLSAETAATSIAKLANITGLTSDEYQKFGSSLVELGNNFATTESDILAMSTRLASAGTLAGLTETEILGLATAMSSVGIEAEAGGTAMTQTLTAMESAAANGSGAFDELRARAESAGYSLTDVAEAVRVGGKELKGTAESMGLTTSELKSMYTESDKAATSLQQFADIANMSSAEFADAWENRPIEAIQAFIKGLGELDAKGESATLALDDMGLSGVRQSNMLKSLALASDTVTSAVDMSTQAWNENTALTDEAGKRYETTESKLKMLKNEIVDVAIDMGGPFVDALRDGLEAGKPLLEWLGNLAKEFSNATPETQQMIVKMIAMTAAAGPLLSIFGKLTGGVGKLGKGFIELTAAAAKKKAITELTTQLAQGAISTDTLATALGAGSSKLTLFGGAAAKASGAGGLGTMISTLATAHPVIASIVGVGGLLALGYGAMKLFGEEADNSANRIKIWGTDVGSATHEALTGVQTNAQQAAAEFSLVEQGISGNTDAIVENFAKMGSSIEENMTNRIEKLKGIVNSLPDDVRDAGNKLTEEEIINQEKFLEIVKENNAKISQIRQRAADENGKITYEASVRIKSLAEESAAAYVHSLGKSEAETKTILTAMTGNVEQATADQAKVWLQTLGKQRQNSKVEYAGMMEDLENDLKDAGYELNSTYAKEMLGLLEESSKSATQITEDQMALILAKYPELVDEVFLGNGQLISAMGEFGQAAVEENRKMLDSFANMTETAAKSAEENAKKIDLVADEAHEFGEYWNSLVLDPKTSEVKTNAQEAVNEAAQSEAGWNKLLFASKHADLSSNAKLMIAEAAIANGKWESMSFTEQHALVESNVTQTMMQAVQAKGKWDGLSFDQQKALLYSNTPEVMAETMLNLGMWNDFQPEIQELEAENQDFLQILSQSEEKINHWGSVPVAVKELLGENYDFLEKVYESEESFNRWKEIPDDQKKMLADNTDFLLTMSYTEGTWNRWKVLPDPEKKLLANNDDLLDKVFASEKSYGAWTELPDNLKLMLANNEDLIAKIDDGTLSLDIYKKNEPNLKKLLGDASSVVTETRLGGTSLDIFKRNNPSAKSLNAIDYVSGVAEIAKNAINSIRDKTVTITANYVVGKGGKDLAMEKGTNFHPGGLALVNDQRGAIYKELITYPSGEAFIPQDRNVWLDLPRGSKVLRASETKRLFPNYEDGIGLSSQSTIVKNLVEVNRQAEQNVTVETKDYTAKLDRMISLFERLLSKPDVVQAVIDAESFNKSNAPFLSGQQSNRNRLAERGLALETRF